jgi:hypothetical protein
LEGAVGTVIRNDKEVSVELLIHAYSNKEDGKMSHVTIKHALFVMIAISIIVGVSVPASVCYAKKQAKGEWAFPEYYPKKFDGEGYIDRIERERIVIDDRNFGFASFTKFSTPTRERASKSQFRPGDLVGYITNKNKEIEALYLLKK